MADEIDPRLLPGGNNPPVEIDPEKLVDVAGLPALLEANYGALLTRSTQFAEALERWRATHLVPAPDDWPEGKAWPVRYAIKDDEDNKNTSDGLRILAGFAGGKSADSGEVNDARERVKKPLRDAGSAVDAFFNGLRSNLRAFVQVMQDCQTVYLKAQVEKERLAREIEARAAQEEAARKALEARQVGGTDEAVDAALAAQTAAEEATARATAAPKELVRSTSTIGTTTTLRTTYKAVLQNKAEFVLAAATPLALRRLFTIPAVAANPALQQAIAAALKVDEPAYLVPLEWVLPNDSAIGASVRGKDGRRAIAGFEIVKDVQAARSGGRGI